ncbi:MAG: PAS domain-containing protein [Acetobacteraceae bacterium]|nr:PAS domain-containing protein [Acetobacteraceae bacterium]
MTASSAAPRRAPSLRSWLLLLAVAVLAPLVLGAGVAAYAAAEAYRSVFLERLRGAARIEAALLGAEIERLSRVVSAFAEEELLRPDNTVEEVREMYARAVRTAARLGVDFGLRGPAPDLPVLFNTALPFGEHGDLPLRGPLREAALAAATTGRVTLSALGPFGPADRLTAMIFAPVQREGRVVALFTTFLDPAALSVGLARRQAARGFAVFAVDGRGRLVAHSARGPEAIGQRVPEEEYAKARDLDHGTIRAVSLVGVPSIIAFERVPGARDWIVASLTHEGAYRASWRSPATSLVLGGLAALFVAMVGASVISSQLLRPLHRLTAAAARIGDAPAVADPAGPGLRVAEFDALRRSVEAGQVALRLETARAEGERALLRSVIDGTADCVFVKDLDGRYVLVNHAAVQAIGQPMDQIVGRTDAEIWPGVAATFDAVDRRVMEQGRTTVIEERVPDPLGGEARVFLTMKSPWREATSGAVAGVIGVAHDITERRRNQERLSDAHQALQRLARRSTVAAMASGIAHELNQPLGAATNYLAGARRLLDAQGEAVPTAAVQATARAAEQMLRAGEILRRLRGFLAGEAAERRPEPAAEVVEDAVRLAVPGDAVELTLDIAPGIGLVRMDRVQVQQVVVNLVRNAIEAMEGQADPARLSVAIRPAGSDAIEVTIADNGPGLPPELEGRLFEAFRSSKVDGMGVGLSICRTIVEEHGGRIGAEPAPGGGTVFRFTLARDGGQPMDDETRTERVTP